MLTTCQCFICWRYCSVLDSLRRLLLQQFKSRKGGEPYFDTVSIFLCYDCLGVKELSSERGPLSTLLAGCK